MINSKYKQFILIVIALIVGLLIGWVLKPSTYEMNDTDDHEHKEELESQIWTCSMHPQIRQNEPGKCPICEMDLIPLESTVTDDPMVLEMTPTAVKLANIQTTTIGEGVEELTGVLRLLGKIKADERLAASQVAHIPGRIEKLYVTFTGEQVRKGQKMAEIYSPELITAQRELLEALKLEDVDPGLADAVRNKLKFWKVGQEAIEAIEEKGEIQELFTLYADATGIVTERKVSVGDYVNIGKPLFELVSLQKVWVLFDAYEEDLSQISVGDKIQFTVPSIPGKDFTTRITFIDPVIDPKTRVASLRAEVNNRNRLLKPEMFVNGKLQKEKKSGSNLRVPKTAVLWTGKRSVVYVKIQDTDIPSFEYREVELGEGMGDSYQVLSGLEDGDEVVTNGNFSIDAAAQLNNQASMMNRNIAIKGAEYKDDVPDFSTEVPAAFKEQLDTLVVEYLHIKDAFVASDPAAASVMAVSLIATLEGVDMSLLQGEAHKYWMVQQNAIHDHASIITGATEVEEQRRQFGFLSTAMINTFTAFGSGEMALYQQHCPMAFDNQGADWISASKEISNPYFGEAMLKCGEIRDSFFN